MDQNEKSNIADVWAEYNKMIAHLETRRSLSASTKRFIEGLKKYYETFGYLTDKQRYSIKATFESYADAD